MHDIATRYKTARRKGWLSQRPILDQCKVPSPSELLALEHSIGCSLPQDMRDWLEIVGFCNFDDDLNFHPLWFRRIHEGHLRGSVLFAQDTLGNFFGFIPPTGEVVFFSRSEPGFALLARSFREFLESLEKRDFKLIDWVESLSLTPYEWGAT